MNQAHSYSQSGQQLWLSPLKAIYWENQKALILSDLHFGKTGHFRKAGIAIPQTIFKDDLHRLFDLVQYFKPRSLIIVGDFFHSTTNKEADLFGKWRNDHSGLIIELIMGNHDILPKEWYSHQQINIHAQNYTIAPFTFVHEWPGIIQEVPNFIFSGHIHPGIRIHGAGRQALRLPCFYFEKDHAILPAFGGFTGLATITPARASNIFAIANENIIRLQ